jgi:hypothetical protein
MPGSDTTIQTMARLVFRAVVLQRNGTENGVKQIAHSVADRSRRSIPPAWAYNSKSKSPVKTAPPNTEVTQYAPSAKPAVPVKAAPQKPASLFDMPAPAAVATAAPAKPEEDLGFAEVDDDEPIDESEELDDAA